MSRPAAGGGRWVEVAPERLAGWLEGFEQRHGAVEVDAAVHTVVLQAADGAVASCAVPFPPLHADPGARFGGLEAHAAAPRRVGVLLVRLGGFAVGVFHGPALVAAKTGARPVHGRSAAGGWSQRRFARRREGQATVALAAAADVAAALLLPVATELDGIVTGGDRRAVDAVLDDPRLTALRPLVTGVPIDVPDPRRAVLEASYERFRRIRIRVVDPP